MKIIPLSPKKTINKALLKTRPLRSDINLFKNNLIKLLSNIDEIEREENQKTHIRDFLRDTYYKNTNEINTKDYKDLVIHLGKTNKDNVGVIIEAKRPGNKTEMITADKPNAKALHELILYYLDERINQNNNELKTLIITNVYEWFIFDANFFDKNIYRNTKVKKLFETYTNDKKDTAFFYEEVSKIIPQIDIDATCAYFDIRDYEKALKNEDLADDKSLIALLKILSPFHLLKEPFADDSNKLDNRFYKEMLHIIGLEEAKENGKIIIRRKSMNRDSGSLMENIISILDTEDILNNIPDKNIFGETKPERLFNIALELSITWINRILFLKLLEGQLFNYHNGNAKYRFLNIDTINDYDELYKLFHQVLARTFSERPDPVKTKYSHVPYLNSSLFEISKLEQQTIKINSLDNSAVLNLINGSILSKSVNKSTLPSLEYLFKFLDSYDFASEGFEDIQEDSKTLVNASVLGKVFEKINGYKDGSIFTPGFITMYMCHQAIRPAIVQKFKDTYSWNVEKFDELKNYIADRKSSNEILEFNNIINSLRICDPAVGSGHFLVSALNELIVAKSELGIFADENGIRITDYEITIENDELIITDLKGNLFSYYVKTDSSTLKHTVNKDAQRLQKTLFHEKQSIIENCLFGVDINQNSVKICRLRLWIELLKNAYYKEESKYIELETLPNIDINIKCGNSLLYRFALDSDLSVALKTSEYSVEQYRGFVNSYKQEKNRDSKRELEKIINSIKSNFRTEIANNDPKQMRFYKLNNEYNALANQTQMFEETKKQKKERTDKLAKLQKEITVLQKELDEIKTNAVYKNAFEWRIEFPEVLDNEGKFIGYDVVIANPPYFSLSKNIYSMFYEKNFSSFSKGTDIYCLFIELASRIVSLNKYLSFIVSNKWMQATYGTKIRKFIKINYKNVKIIDFGKHQLFDEVSVDVNILEAVNCKTGNEVIHFKKYDKSDINCFLNNSKNYTSLNTAGLNTWHLVNSELNVIKSKIEEGSKPLEEFGDDFKFYRGITTGFNDAFVISEELKSKLIQESPKNAEIIKPLLRGRDIQKYYYTKSNLFLINVHNGLKTDNIKRIILESEYPTILNHLIFFKTTLEKRQDVGDVWYNLRNCAYLNDFEKEKLVFTKASKIQSFAYDNEGNYLLNTSYFATGKDLKIILGILNSRLIGFAFKNFYQAGGIDGEITLQAIERLPIKDLNLLDKKLFISIVDQILEAKKQNKETTTLESEINTLVYKLYNLTPEEIKIVESQ